ncbi:MAG: hypothetical protein ACRDKT_14540 [Actinomycetota bacterium]
MDSDLVVIVMASVGLWVAHAVALSALMSRRGFDRLAWFAVPLLMGPASWPLALVEGISGPPPALIVHRGRRHDGTLDVAVVLEHDRVPEETAPQVARVLPDRGRLLIARVVAAGGPTVIENDAAAFLVDAARTLHAEDASLRIVFGTFEGAVARIQQRGGFSLVIRSDHPDEVFEGDGFQPEMRCQRDVTAA